MVITKQPQIGGEGNCFMIDQIRPKCAHVAFYY